MRGGGTASRRSRATAEIWRRLISWTRRSTEAKVGRRWCTPPARDAATRFSLPSGCRFSYGTAGFRADGATMAPAVCRAGILAALRSLKLAGAAVGIVITASHNPVGDNCVKIADPDGGMMAQHWEPFADALANAPDPDALLQCKFMAMYYTFR